MQVRRIMYVVALAWAATGCVAGGGGGGGGSADGGPAGGQGGAGGAGGGGTGGTPTVDGAPIASPESFTRQAGAVWCRELSSCCATQGVNVAPAQCEGLFSSMLMSDSGVVYDPEAAGDCLATLRTLRGCEVTNAPAICGRVFQGDVPLGEPCTADVDCAPLEGGTVSCGFDDYCVGEVRGSAGDECSSTCTQDPATNSTTCFGSGDRAEPGVPEIACFTNDGLSCGRDGTCTALVTEGGDCSGGRLCVDGLECRREEDTLTCQPYPALGEPCQSACAEGYCPDDPEPVCTPAVPLGGACDPESFTDPCGAGAACADTGVCEEAGEGPLAFVCGLLAGEGGF